jgi:polyhydroxybutyrate depolymerase
MRLRFLLCCGLLLAASGLRAQSTITGTIRFGGAVRDYRLYVPRAYTGNQAVPLLLNLHGYGSNNLEQEQYGDFRAIADTANFLVVHPNGTLDGTGSRYWNTFTPPGSGGPDDVAFLAALIDTLSARYRIDANRVYSTGMSNGGFMSYELACQLSGRIAAIASVTGSMVASRQAVCMPGRAVPILEIHGTADGTVPYNGNILFLPIPTLLASWVQRNGCNPTPIITQVPDINTADGSTVERQLYTGGRNGSVVEHYRIIGGGHTWPGAPVNIGVTNRDINASREIWRFLRPYRLTGLVTSTKPETSGRLLQLAPNPAQELVTLRAEAGQPLTRLRVTDALGRVVPATPRRTSDGSLQLSTSGWAPGIYWVQAEVAGQPVVRKLVKE